jgi:hypothetical protein
MSRPLRQFGAAVMIGALLSACDVQVGDKGVSVNVVSEQARDVWTRSYAVGAGTRLDVSIVNGAMDVVAAEGSDATIAITRTASAMSQDAAREALERVTITEQAADGQVRIEVQPADRNARRGRATVTALVRLPPGTVAALRTQNGSVQMTGVRGTLTVATTNGAVIGRDLGGALSVSVVNGRLDLDLATVVTDPVTLSVLNGGVRLGIPPSAAVEIDASALNGGVTIAPPLSLVRDGDAGQQPGVALVTDRVTGRLNGGGPKITAQVTNGGLRIGPPAEGTSRPASPPGRGARR